MPDNILIIEGEPALRKEIASALAEAVFAVADVADYFEALLKLGEFKPDLVVLDEELPLVDGWEACYQLHQILGVPVILLGEDYSDEVWIRALEAGADFYLRMPVSCQELAARIKAILRRYRKRRNNLSKLIIHSFPLSGDGGSEGYKAHTEC